MTRSVLWFRRDLRLGDHPALLRAAEAGPDGVLPLFVLDPALWRPSGDVRRLALLRSLAALDASLAARGTRLVTRAGNPRDVVEKVVEEAGATSVHVTADAAPYGRRRDDAVAAALAAKEVPLVRTGTPYAVGPGILTTGDGGRFRVFSPFRRAWTDFGHPAPAPTPSKISWFDGVASDSLPEPPLVEGLSLPAAGEAAAGERWARFLEQGVARYDADRNRPDRPGTSLMSGHLKYGEIHPRTMLAMLQAPALTGTAGARRMRSELCWRDFYADVLWHRPDSAREPLDPAYARLRYDEPGPAFEAWCAGRTGYPLIDAGMRQLRAEGWMHNRVRMATASFLVKDLHVDWRHGARFFMRWLRDGDLASNQHGWQWTAGTGTDAAPYVRVFNPTTQAERFDPKGEYVRKYVPELRHLPGAAALTPWDVLDGYAQGYPERIVDHADERREALARHAELSA